MVEPQNGINPLRHMGVGQNGICAVLSRSQLTRTAYATTAYICRSVPLASDQNGICHNGKNFFGNLFEHFGNCQMCKMGTFCCFGICRCVQEGVGQNGICQIWLLHYRRSDFFWILHYRRSDYYTIGVLTISEYYTRGVDHFWCLTSFREVFKLLT